MSEVRFSRLPRITRRDIDCRLCKLERDILSTINGFSLFIEPYVMTGGGPVNSTLSMNLYIYRQAFEFYKMGYAATLGFVLAGMVFVVVALQRKFIEREF